MFQDFIKKGVIDPIEFKSIILNESVCLLDASYALPNSGINPQKNFEEKRIPGAQFFDISGVSDKKSLLPHMLPSSVEFEQAAARLGIENDDLVVIYGQGDMAMGPARAWWMFRVFGHNNVVVLDGGLPAWVANGGELETTPVKMPSPSSYKVIEYRQDIVCDIKKIAGVSLNGLCPILDARPKARFDGTQPEPRAGLQSGHIPNSLNLPAGALVDSETGKMKSVAGLQELFKSALSASEIILTCGSGVTACMLALGLFRLGYDKVSVYDGSWAEWGQETSGLDVVKAS